MRATLWRAVGALTGGVGGVAAGIVIHKAFDASPGWVVIAVVGLIVVSVVLYLVARTRHDPAAAAGQFMPGLLLGFTTGINAVLLEAIVGLVPALIICAIPLLAVIEPLASSDVFQAPLGWVNLLLPMSWPILAVGLVLLVLTGLLALVNLLLRTDFLKVRKLNVDAKTGTLVVDGGFGGNINLNQHSDGYNVGIAYLRSGHSTDYLREHESGHTLNLAIFGWVVHLIGAFDENVFGGGVSAYTELFAESNVPSTYPEHTGRPIFPMWVDA